MTTPLAQKITEITLGIRFSRAFRISDVSGEIIDNILRDPLSPFDTKYFPKFDEGSLREKILFNKKGDSIKITPDDFILTLKIEDDFEKNYKFISDRFIPYANFLFNLFEIDELNRIGILYTIELAKPKALDKTIQTLTNESLTSSHNFNLEFTRKIKTVEGRFKKGVKDYVNIIYTFRKDPEEKAVDFRYDYQKFYSPYLSNLKDGKIDELLSESRKNLEAEYDKWIKKYEED